MKRQHVFVAGHNGMVGRALCRAISLQRPDVKLVCADRSELDLRNRPAVEHFLKVQPIDYVIVAAATVGGIRANDTRPAEFISDNLAIALNLIDGSWRAGIHELLFLGSSCIYPRDAAQPIAEGALLGGPLERTNEPYAVAKIAGIKLCESYNRQYGTDFRSIMPTNLYGPYDRFDLLDGHVIPALMRRLHEHKTENRSPAAIWGSGEARREFLHVDDLARACLTVMDTPVEALASMTEPQQSHINVGTGSDISIRDLAQLLTEVVHYRGDLRFDTSMPDGTPVKRLDTRLINSLGWAPEIELREGLESTYRWFLKQAGQE